LVADISEARLQLGWQPRRSGLEQIVVDAVAVRAPAKTEVEVPAAMPRPV
jgi:hypothetical protein